MASAEIYIELTDKLNQWFELTFINYYEGVRKYNSIIKEIREKCDKDEAYQVELKRCCDKRVAIARIHNIFESELQEV